LVARMAGPPLMGVESHLSLAAARDLARPSGAIALYGVLAAGVLGGGRSAALLRHSAGCGRQCY